MGIIVPYSLPPPSKLQSSEDSAGTALHIELKSHHDIHAPTCAGRYAT